MTEEKKVQKINKVGNIYVVGLPPQFLREDAADQDKRVMKHYKDVLQNLVESEENENFGIILPIVRDEVGQPLFTFETYVKATKYKFKQTFKIGDMESTLEANSIPDLKKMVRALLEVDDGQRK
jgi:hypothetical protein